MKNRSKSSFAAILIAGTMLILALVFVLVYLPTTRKPAGFDAARAYNDVFVQVSFGPRTPGSTAHSATVDYIRSELEQAGWEVEIQETEMLGHPIRNIIARRGSGSEWVVIGAHYDSRFVADRDPDPVLSAQPVMGANDGASGVAVLLELARSLPKKPEKQIWLVFFDAEDQGNIEGWDWILGSRAFAQSLENSPSAVVVVDMIGDANLNIYREKSSDVALTDEIWSRAAELGYEQFFIDEPKYHILDDHTPFLEKGIRAIDIIDFNYDYWHTSQDTADKVSQESLGVIGEVLLSWLLE